MAFTSGTATDYLDLLNRLKQFVTQDMLPANERWTVLRWVPGPPAELVLQGPGLAGTDQINVGILSEAGADYGNRLYLWTPNPVQPGSSVSHYDRSAKRNLLMEPNISDDLTSSVNAPQDLTFELLRDIGW